MGFKFCDLKVFPKITFRRGYEFNKFALFDLCFARRNIPFMDSSLGVQTVSEHAIFTIPVMYCKKQIDIINYITFHWMKCSIIRLAILNLRRNCRNAIERGKRYSKYIYLSIFSAPYYDKSERTESSIKLYMVMPPPEVCYRG